MEKFETTPILKYGITTTTEEVGGNNIEVEWIAAPGEDREGNVWEGKIRGKGSDGSQWEGEGQIMRVQVEGKTVALNADNVSTRRLVKESVQ